MTALPSVPSVEVFHPLTAQPDAPEFHDLLSVLNDGVRAAADIAEIAVIRDAVARHAPLLGIRRGLQLINVSFGGTLVQHLPPDRRQRDAGADPFVTTTVVPVPGTDADGLDLASPVRCTHHQAVGELGDGLTVVARAGDGVVEAVLHEDAPLTGVQWHPEHSDVAVDQLTALLERMRGQLDRVSRPDAVAS